MSKSIQEWQQIVDQWIQQTGGYWAPLSNLARVTEEVGELARLLNHLYGEKPKKPTEEKQELGVEICDIIFVLICIANREGVDLDTSFAEMMEKYRVRDRDRYVKQSPKEGER